MKSTVKSILMNPVYTGKTVANRSTYKSFKDKRKVDIPEEEWIITEGTHEALVSQEDYDTVYKRLSVKCRNRTDNPDNIFRGLVKCPDCGRIHGFSKRYDNRGSKGAYTCQISRRYGKKYCSSHYITFEQLYGVVLSDVQLHAKLAKENADKYVETLLKVSDEDNASERKSLTKESDKAKKRISELDTLIQKLYEDMTFGVISRERYITMSQNMENELAMLKARIGEIENTLTESANRTENAEKFARLIASYTDITELDEEMLHTLIESIYVHERENIDGKGVVKVDIYYRFIGKPADFGSPTEVIRRRS